MEGRHRMEPSDDDISESNDNNALSEESECVTSIPGYDEEVFSDSDIDINKMCTLHRLIWKAKDEKVLRYLSKKNNENKINKQDETGRYDYICTYNAKSFGGRVRFHKSNLFSHLIQTFLLFVFLIERFYFFFFSKNNLYFVAQCGVVSSCVVLYEFTSY